MNLRDNCLLFWVLMLDQNLVLKQYSGVNPENREALLHKKQSFVSELQELNSALVSIGETPIHMAVVFPPYRGLSRAILDALPAKGYGITLENLMKKLPTEYRDCKMKVISSLSYLKTRRNMVMSPQKGVYKKVKYDQ